MEVVTILVAAEEGRNEEGESYSSQACWRCVIINDCVVIEDMAV